MLLGQGVAHAAAGTVESIVGTGRIIQSHGHERPAMKGDSFYDGDTLVTLANSNMKLRMQDDAQIWLRPDTRLKVEKYTATQRGGSRDEARLQLITGSLRELTGSIGKSTPSDYRLATPNATIGIRGTDFDAVYVSPQESAQLGTQPGTYNRVYAGSTALSGPAGLVVLATGQAGFMGLAANSQPQVLPSIPPFLNNPAPTTSATPGASARSLQISVRTGEAPGNTGSSTISSSQSGAGAASEQRVRVNEGERAQLALAQGTATGRLAGGRPASQMALEVMATVSGNTAQVQLRMQSQNAGPGGGNAQAVATTVSMPMGSWTEITGRVNTSQDAVVRSNSQADTRVFLRVDDVGR